MIIIAAVRTPNMRSALVTDCYVDIQCGSCKMVQQRSRTRIQREETLYLLNSSFPFAPPLAPGSHHAAVCLCVSDSSVDSVWVRSCGSVFPRLVSFQHDVPRLTRMSHTPGRISFFKAE